MTEEAAHKPDLAVPESQFSQLLEGLRSTQITADNYPTIMGILVQCKAHAKTYTARRDEALNPAKQTANTIKGWFDPVLKSLEEIEQTLKEKAVTYVGAQAAQRITMAQAGQQPAAPPPQIDGVTFREQWDFKVINSGMLSEDLLKPDESAIRKRMKEQMGEDGPTPIPGVKFFRRQVIAVAIPKALQQG